MTDNNETTAWNGVLGGGNTAPQCPPSERAELGLLVLATAAAGVITTGISLWGWGSAHRDAELARAGKRTEE